MTVKVVKNEREYHTALKRADEIFHAKPNTKEGEEFSLLLLVIKDYEDRHHAVPVPDPIEVLKIKMQEKGWSNKDLEPYIGSKSYVSQILNKRKPLTAEIMRVLHSKLGIPAQILLAS
jgi:HTH-type transcriptional regulator / antitoxin HigA